MLKKFVNHLFWSFILCIVFLVPDHIYHLFNKHYPIGLTLKFFLIMYAVSFLILSIKNKKASYVVFIFVMLLQFAQFLNFNFFGNLIYPYDVKLLFSDFDEIFLTLSSNLHIFTAPLISILPVALFMVFINKNELNVFKFEYSHILFFVLLLILPIKAYLSHNILNFFPSVKSYSIKNTLYALSYFLGKGVFENSDNIAVKKFKPYIVKELNNSTDKLNIVYVMGESCNYKYMSLFGYDKNTTPLLDSLRNDKNFEYKKIISIATNTRVSLSMFFNVIREPQNYLQLVSRKSNLFNLAKKHGFKTYFLSKQKDKVISNFLSVNDIDVYKNVYDYPTNYDTDLLKDLEKIDFDGKNFIVLHQRSSHTPYNKYYPKSFEKFHYDKNNYADYMKGTYLNSMLFTDYFLYNVIKIMKEKALKTHTKAIFIFTPDHGELVGDNGKYGHVALDINCVKIPLIIYTVNMSKPDISRFLSHYDVGKMVAKMLGFKIINPNDDNKTIYVNGVDIAGRAGFMKLERDKVYKELYGKDIKN